MDNTKRATLIWSLGAVIFSLTGVYVALTYSGAWHQVVSAVILLLAGCVFAAKAVLTLRTRGRDAPRA